MSKVIEPTTDTLARPLDWLDSTPEEQARIRSEVEIEMTPGSMWLERQMAGDGQGREKDHGFCTGCIQCFDI